MLGGVRKVVMLNEDTYELTLEDGTTKRVAALRTTGKRSEGLYHHEVRFSDGTVQRHVVSTESMVIPDYPALQPASEA